jgi:SAM-dependent methyltransferase
MYTKRSVRYYDAIYAARGKDYAREVELLHGLIQRYKRSPSNTLLDVACGTGGHIVFLRQQYAIEGLDIDVDMLEVARGKCPGIAFHRGDMLDFRLDRQFGVVVCLFSSLAYVKSVQKLVRAVENMNRHVEPGGLVIAEPWVNREAFRAGSIHATYVDLPDLKIARVNTSTVADRVSVINFHYLVGTPDGVEYFTEHHRMGLFSHDEYLTAFRSAGLEVFHDPDGLMGRGLYIGRRGLI